jgi:poly(A) polymerase-like protein
MAESIEKRVARRLAGFLKRSPRKSLARVEPIRTSVVEVLHRATSRQWRTYVVGGAIRDLLLGPKGSWPRDVDVIVDGCSTRQLEAVFEDILIRRNRFGGLHLKRTVGTGGAIAARVDLLFDVWRLQDTWGIKARHLAPTISNFLATPFLNIDSIAVALSDDSGQPTVYERGFFQAVRTRTLEINNEPNPFPFVCAARSLILAATLNFRLGTRLAHFIHTLMATASVSELVNAQRSHYGQIRCREEEIRQWLSNLRSQLDAGSETVLIQSTPERQSDLWQDWPPHSELQEDEWGYQRTRL